MDHDNPFFQDRTPRKVFLKKDIFFLFLLTIGIVLHLYLFFAANVEQDKELSCFQEYVHDKIFNPEDESLQAQTTLGLFLIALFSIGLSVNFFLFIFFILDRQGARRLLFPFYDAKRETLFEIKDILYLIIFGYFTTQIFRSVFSWIRMKSFFSPDALFILNLISGTLVLQLVVLFFLFLYSFETYHQTPRYLAVPRKNIFRKLSATAFLFLAMFPWIFLLALFGLMISQKFNIPVRSHAITDYIIKNRLDFSSFYMIAYAVLGAPFFEEIIFRGFVYTTIRKHWGITSGLIVTSIIFSLFHMNFLQFFYIFGLGVALALVYEATSSLWFSIFLHSINNAMALLLTFLLKYH